MFGRGDDHFVQIMDKEQPGTSQSKAAPAMVYICGGMFALHVFSKIDQNDASYMSAIDLPCCIMIIVIIIDVL